MPTIFYYQLFPLIDIILIIAFHEFVFVISPVGVCMCVRAAMRACEFMLQAMPAVSFANEPKTFYNFLIRLIVDARSLRTSFNWSNLIIRKIIFHRLIGMKEGATENRQIDAKNNKLIKVTKKRRFEKMETREKYCRDGETEDGGACRAGDELSCVTKF